jgi:predicted RNA-binding Zn ribbon-like protein
VKRRKTYPALRLEVEDQISDLKVFSWMLNRDIPDDSPIRSMVEAVIAADQAGTGRVGELPWRIGEVFRNLASGTTFEYGLLGWRPHLTWMTEAGKALRHFVEFLNNPSRNRFRRCPTCGKFFADGTRNRIGRRCSIECTIKWSTQQRSLRRQARRSK